jgi:hypothetical protein
MRGITLCAALSAAAVAAIADGGKPMRLDFESDTAGQPPKGFTLALTGEGRPGKWIVRAVPDAPSGKNVLEQSDGDPTDYRFPIAFTGPDLKDLRLSVKCKPIAGKVDQGCGLVWRLQGADDYYIARLNALEDNVHLYRTIKGKRLRFDGWDGKVKSGVWHELAVEMRGDAIQIFFDGKRVIEAKDSTFPGAGKVGVWTKADSIIQFDDLTAEAL